jgi:glycine C-acetyltransferase
MAALQDQGLFINIRTVDSPQGGWLVVDGKRVLNFCSNNYLGLANHPRLCQAAKEAIDKYGIGPAAVRTIAGTMRLHVDLEQRLALFKRVEDAIFLQSGYAANLAAITTLVSREDVIFSDELNHASIIDACRLSHAEIIRYAHCDPDDLRAKVLARGVPGTSYRRALLVTDGVFSMDGDIAPLPDLLKVAQEFGLMFMVDDAHGEGVLGEGGRGIVDHFGLHGQVDIEIGTLSKAMGVVGGVVAGRKLVIEFLRQRSRPFLFSSAVTVPDTAACLAAVYLLKSSEDLVQKLWQNTAYLRQGLQALGFDTGRSQTPIVPVMLGDAHLAKRFSDMLFDEGVFAMSLGYPTVPQGKARIRIMNTAAHSQDDLDFGLAAMAKVGKALGVIR